MEQQELPVVGECQDPVLVPDHAAIFSERAVGDPVDLSVLKIDAGEAAILQVEVGDVTDHQWG